MFLKCVLNIIVRMHISIRTSEPEAQLHFLN